MKIGCLLSVREKATRLPKKVLLDIMGEPLTQRLLQRLSMASEPDIVVLSTSIHEDDDVLVELAASAGFAYFRGNEDDKLDRYYQTALYYGLDAVVIVDGDDLFCFPEGVDLIAKELRNNNYDCVYFKGLPLGAAATGVTTKALARVLQLKEESDTEVWGGYFIGSGFFSSKCIEIENGLWSHPEIRLTLDYDEDYQFIVKVISELENSMDFSSDMLMDLLINRKPELCQINQMAQQRYEAHLSKAAPVKFKQRDLG